ncbi:MAG: class I SAM-dependent methyltransferase [Thermomicrobiales bacterium]
MVDQPYAASVSAHYTSGDLGERILAGLRAAGKDPDALTIDDLTPVDQFHPGGKPATLQLIERAGMRPRMSVLDVGGGLGGPARTLATQRDATVTVLDLSEEFCRVGEMLTARTDLSDRVTFRHGNALALPFADNSFDLVWTQFSTMNVADKQALAAEIHRVVRPGGRYALHETMAGPVQPIHFPVPWANDPSISFLQSPEDARATLAAAGFTEIAWAELAAPEIPASSAPSGPPPLGMQILIDNIGEKMRNLRRNHDEGRIVTVQGVFERLP